MMHLATAQLDRGPVVGYFRLPLRGADWDRALGPVPREAQDHERRRDRRRGGRGASRCSPRSGGAARCARSRCCTRRCACSPRGTSTRRRRRVRRVGAAADGPHRAGRRRGREVTDEAAGRGDGPGRIYVTDCEGPLTRNDNAQEIAERFLPDGAEFFARLSKYDDFLVDVAHKPGLQRRQHAAPDPAVLQAPSTSPTRTWSCSAPSRCCWCRRALKALDADPRAHARLHHLDLVHAVPARAVRARRLPVRARALHGAEPRRLGHAGGRGGVAARLGRLRLRAARHRDTRTRRSRSRGHAGATWLADSADPGDVWPSPDERSWLCGRLDGAELDKLFWSDAEHR